MIYSFLFFHYSELFYNSSIGKSRSLKSTVSIGFPRGLACPVVYRFGFNSMEKDDETYGEGNAYDFGSRIYDARKGSWLSVDPLQMKYPSLTPYHFTGNNPIIHIDKDGKDYEIVIDHKAKTITIVATYYVAEGNMEDKAGAMAGISVWNKASGVYEYKTGGVSYKINFNLTVKEVKDPIESANKDASGNSYAINNEAVILIGGKNALGAAAKEGETNAKHIVVKKNRPDEVDPHEVGHTLGIGHTYKGFMRKYSGKLNVSNKVILGYVAEILKDNRLGSRQSILEGEEDRNVSPKTTYKKKEVNAPAPKNFESGDVERTDGNTNYIDY